MWKTYRYYGMHFEPLLSGGDGESERNDFLSCGTNLGICFKMVDSHDTKDSIRAHLLNSKLWKL